MGLKLTFAPLSDVGRERAENQDAFGSEHQDGFDFYIVCDGMGGHRAGSTAARLAVDTIVAHLADHPDAPPEERIVDALVAANRDIVAKASGDPRFHGMGTTAVVLAIDRERGTAHYAHVGDSRLYLVRDDTIRQLTRDHTFVQRLVDDGILDPASAANHPQGNVIIRSLGGQPDVDVELGDTPIELQDGDVFLLCSDGLHGPVAAEELAFHAVDSDLERAATALVALANQRGGADNITVELVRVGERAAPAPELWTVRHPTPAPGTRLARLADREAGRDGGPDPEAERDTAPVRAPVARESGGGPSGSTPTTTSAGSEEPPSAADSGTRPATSPRDSSSAATAPLAGANLGPLVAVVVVAVIVAAAFALYAVVRSGAPPASDAAPADEGSPAVEPAPAPGPTDGSVDPAAFVPHAGDESGLVVDAAADGSNEGSAPAGGSGP